MSKTTKIIAALGVVAGLGVAALPAFTFATETVTGNVDLYVEVQPAIAMTIEGNNDDRSHYGTPTYSVATVEEGASVEGLYTRSENEPYVYTPATGTAQPGTTYYSIDSQSVDVFSPAEAASSSIDGHITPATAKIGPSSSWIAMLPNATANGSDTNGFKSTIHVYTNAAGGYNLNIKDSDSTLALTKVGSTETIPAGTESEGSFALVAGTAAWGYKVDTASEDGTGYKAITAGDVQIKQQSAPTSAESNRKTTVYYGVATASDQATGVYTDTITYTATTR